MKTKNRFLYFSEIFGYLLFLSLTVLTVTGCESGAADRKKPRVVISTDIGGTDPDDNQSMIHYLMYANEFDTEGLISSPSYGDGSKEEILRMIDFYEKDYDKLQEKDKDFPEPDTLRAISKQGRRGAAPFAGYDSATEGSDWIIRCAEKEDDRPLWVLVWGGLKDLAQALHDAPGIQDKLRVYWIGGPNKKWSANAYAYIAENFPDLWFIECNSTYRGFFSDEEAPDDLSNKKYYARFAEDAGHLGQDFKNYYRGEIKMGDTPSLLYLMNGSPEDPLGESWGGRFEKLHQSPRIVFDRVTTPKDTVTVYSVIELNFRGPELDIPADSACFTMSVEAKVGTQDWDGYYRGDGNYTVRYCPKQTETISYRIISGLPGFEEKEGALVVDNIWPGRDRPHDYPLGENWFTDIDDPEEFAGIWQGAKTIGRWRTDILEDWTERWNWLK